MSEAKQTAKLALEALEDKKAMDVRILDITHVSTLADYFMIASGSNRNQVQACPPRRPALELRPLPADPGRRFSCPVGKAAHRPAGADEGPRRKTGCGVKAAPAAPSRLHSPNHQREKPLHFPLRLSGRFYSNSTF